MAKKQSFKYDILSGSRYSKDRSSKGGIYKESKVQKKERLKTEKIRRKKLGKRARF